MKQLLRVMLAAAILAAPGQVFAQTGKPVIAIYQMDDIARSGLSATLSTMIETSIAGTSKFRVIERERIDKLVGEQARAKAGLVTSNTPGKIGGFEGADFLIYGPITTVALVNKSDFSSGLVAGLLSGSSGKDINCNNAYATLGLDIKITDARSGEVKYVTRINETQKSTMACGGDKGVIDAPKLMRATADKVASGLVTAIYPIQVAAVQPDGTMVLNYGEGTIEPDAVMAVYTKGQAIRDPATGEILANDEVRLGYVKVSAVTGRVSKVTPVTAFASAPAIGSIVRPASNAEVQALLKSQRRR